MVRPLALTLLSIAMGSVLLAADAGKDHPLVTRYPGATIRSEETKAFDEVRLPLGPYRGGKFTSLQPVQGKVTRIVYTNPKGRSTLEIERNYEEALVKAGFQVLFRCGGAECADPGVNEELPDAGRWCVNGIDCAEPMRYLAAKLPRKAGDVYVSVKVINNEFSTAGTALTVVETRPMEGGLITANAGAMRSDIATSGHAAIYGIYFDTGKAELKPASDATLAEIARLLKANPSMKLYVVGHTDNVGGHAANMELSRARAAAVVKALVTRNGVAASRLEAAGVGSLAPVATNRTEEGRAKNRRVELVEQ